MQPKNYSQMNKFTVLFYNTKLQIYCKTVAFHIEKTTIQRQTYKCMTLTNTRPPLETSVSAKTNLTIYHVLVYKNQSSSQDLHTRYC